MTTHKKKHLAIGLHTSITPSIIHALKYAQALGATAIQIFTGSTISTSLKQKHKISHEEITEIHKYLAITKITIAIHAVYSLNFCSHPANSARIRYAQTNLIYDLEFAHKIGAKYVVLHLGNQMKLPLSEALDNMISNIVYILNKTANTASSVTLTLETSASQGTQIGKTLPTLSDLFHKIIHKLSTTQQTRLGICVDTAHIFASGYDITTPTGIQNYITEFTDTIGIKYLRLIHLNDSRNMLNSHLDRHEGLGDGYLFGKTTPDTYLLSLKHLITFANTRQIPVILETHRAGSETNPNGELYAQELSLLNRLATKTIKNTELRSWKLKHLKTVKTGRQPTPGTNVNNPINPANLGLLNKLLELQKYYTVVDTDKIRALAYRKAATTIRNYPEEILNGAQIAHLDGIGAKMVIKIDEYLKTGKMTIFQKLDISQKLKDATKLSDQNISAILGIGPARARVLAQQHIYRVSQLRDAVTKNRIKITPMEAIGLKYHNDLIKQIPRNEAAKILNKINTVLTRNGLTTKYGLRLELAGSYPTGKLESKDIDILVFSNKINTHRDIKGNTILSEISEILSRENIQIALVALGNTKILSLAQLDTQHPVRHIDIRLIPLESEIFGRFYFTSGRDFNQIIRQAAKSAGYKLNEFGLYHVSSGALVSGLESEEDIMARIGVPFVPLNSRR